MRSPHGILRRRIDTSTLIVSVGVLLLTGLTAGSASAGGGHGDHGGRGPDNVQLEHLDRGLVAASTSDGVFLSWRLLGYEVTGRTATGMAGPDFRVYRDGRLVATVTDSTNYLDAAGTGTAEYRV